MRGWRARPTSICSGPLQSCRRASRRRFAGPVAGRAIGASTCARIARAPCGSGAGWTKTLTELGVDGLTFHHVGVACSTLDAEEKVFTALGYVREHPDFVDPVQGVHG